MKRFLLTLAILFSPVLANAESGTLYNPATSGVGSGDVVGPASSTNNAAVLFDGTTGKLLKNSSITFPLADANVSDTLTSSLFVGSGSTTNAIDLATAEVAGTLPDSNVADALTISSGTVNNSIIGGSAPAAGTFTTVTSPLFYGKQGVGAILEVPDIGAASDDAGLGIQIIADDGGTLLNGGSGGGILIKAGNAGAGVGDAGGGSIIFESGDFTGGEDRGYFLFQDADDKRVLLLTPVNGVATNYLHISNAITGGDVLIETIGTDANIDLSFNPQGTGAIVFDSAQIKYTGTTTLSTTEIGCGISSGTPNDLTCNVGSGASHALWVNGGSQLDVSSATINIFNNDIRWGSAGVAVTADKYQILRDNDATNQMHFNVPSGSGFEFSSNDVAKTIMNDNEILFNLLVRFGTQTVSVADDGAGTPALATVTPNRSNIQITCNDPHGCNITLGEAGMASGYEVTLVNVSANNVVFADTAGVSELAGGFTAGQYDPIKIMYQSDRWVENSRSNN